ncbi:MAG: PQQ-binding-like beta-propeller repeat protein [Pseudomonadota bacterium]
MIRNMRLFCTLSPLFVLLSLTASAGDITELKDNDGMVVAERMADGEVRYLSTPRLPAQYPPAFVTPPLPKDAHPDSYIFRFYNDLDRNGRIQPDGTVVPIDRNKPVKKTASPDVRNASTIDTALLSNYDGQYAPYLPLIFQGQPDQYLLSNGLQFNSGSGSIFRGRVQLANISEQNGVITYVFDQFANEEFFDVTDFGTGGNGTAFELALDSEMTLVAELGSSTGQLSGDLLILNVDPGNVSATDYRPLSSIVGATVPFTATLTNNTGSWQVDSFDALIDYTSSNGVIDFANPTTSPALVELRIAGPSQLPPAISTAYQALAVFANGEELNVNDSTVWTTPDGALFDLSPDGVATTQEAPPTDTIVTINAQFENVQTSVEVNLIGNDTLAQGIDGWGTYQRGPDHTGWTDISTESDLFNVLWSVPLDINSSYHQPVADDERVILTLSGSFFSNSDLDRLYAYDPLDGSLLWSKSFPNARQLNGPALAYGNIVLIDEALSGADQLRLIDGVTGDEVYSRDFPDNQVEGETLSPTVVDGDFYVRGNFSDLYRMSFFTGEVQWVNSDIQQVRATTPTVDEQYVYSFYSNTLTVMDRLTGEIEFELEKPSSSFSSSSVYAVILNEDSSSAFVMNGSDLTRFNLVDKRHEWTIDENFNRQPAYHNGRLYTYSFNEFYAIDAQTGEILWTYDPPSSSFSDDIIITNNHAFVGHSSDTLAIDLNSQQTVWSYPSRGRLSLSGETLYIVGSNQSLTAVQVPGLLNVPPTSITIDAPATVEENSVVQLRATVTYDDGRVRDRTTQSVWSIKPNSVSTIGQSGRLSVGELLTPREMVTVSAAFTEAGSTVEVSADIELATLLSDTDFALRNLDMALAIKESIINQLADAIQREQSARAALQGLPGKDEMLALAEVISALDNSTVADGALDTSAESLANAIAILNGQIHIRQRSKK